MAETVNQRPDFEDTSIAFAYKSDKDLKKAHFLFKLMNSSFLVNIGTSLTPMVMRWGLPVNGLIRNTIFRQFVGGESMEETGAVAELLAKYGVNVILDYGVEGKSDEESFDKATEVFLKVIKYASSNEHIPFMSIKLTGIARFGLLEKLDAAAKEKLGYTGLLHTGILTEQEREELKRVKYRLDRIVQFAAESGVGVLVDAEESWIQDPMDALVAEMMEKYNKAKAIVYNTFQLYRSDRLEFLKASHKEAREKGYILGAKIVRGAYMEKERERALEKGYPSPIQPDKPACDKDYNEAVDYCIRNHKDISVIIASHNQDSNLLGTEIIDSLGIPHNHPHINFSQLYGMSDHITFNLARKGYNVSKYLPFGPIKDVIPYLMRRAEENSSVSGQTGRELSLIRKEMQRRGLL
jgi:proline dehydrogenase